MSALPFLSMGPLLDRVAVVRGENNNPIKCETRKWCVSVSAATTKNNRSQPLFLP